MKEPEIVDAEVIEEPGKPSKADINLAVACHLLQLAAFILPLVGMIIAPLILWLAKRGESRFLDRVGCEVVNFTITVVLMFMCCGLLSRILPWLGSTLASLTLIWWLVMVIVGTLAAREGRVYRHPFTLRLVK